MASGTDERADEPADAPAAAYVAVFAVYVILGFLVRSVVLNWIVGPLFLLLALYVLPAALRRVRP